MPDSTITKTKPVDSNSIKTQIETLSTELEDYKNSLNSILGNTESLTERIRNSGVEVREGFFTDSSQQEFLNSLGTKENTEAFNLSKTFNRDLNEDLNTLKKYINTSAFKQLPSSTQNTINTLSQKYQKYITDTQENIKPLENKVKEEKAEIKYKELNNQLKVIKQKENDFKVVDPTLETDSNLLLKNTLNLELKKEVSINKIQGLLESGKLQESYTQYTKYLNQEKLNRENLQKLLNSPRFQSLTPQQQERFREYVRQTGELWNGKQDLFNNLTNSYRDLDSNIENTIPDGSYSPNLFGKEGALRQSNSGVLYDKENKVINTESWGIRFTACSSQESFLFELLPAINSTLPIQGSRDVPNAMAGLTFSIKPNIAKFKIAGFQPVYQHLGIDTVIVTIVGAFTGNEGYNTSPTDLDLAGSFHFKAFSDRKTEGVKLEEVFKTISRKEDSFKQFNRFYNLTSKEEVEVEINTAKYDTFDIESEAKTGVDRKTDLDKDPPYGFRDKRTGNPKFKGFIKSLEAAYVRNNRTYYVIQVEISDFGLVNATPPKLDYVPDTNDTFTPNTPTDTNAEQNTSNPIDSIGLGDNEYIFKNPEKVQKDGGEYLKYNICQFKNDQIAEAKQKNLISEDGKIIRSGGINTTIIPFNCRTEYKQLSSLKDVVNNNSENLNPEEMDFLKQTSSIYSEGQGYILNTLKEKTLSDGRKILSADLCSETGVLGDLGSYLNNITNNLSSEEEKRLRDLKVSSPNCGIANRKTTYYLKDVNNNIFNINKEIYDNYLKQLNSNSARPD